MMMGTWMVLLVGGWLSCMGVIVWGAPTETPPIRNYYIAAEEVDWDYTPQHWDHYRNQSLDEMPAHTYTHHNATRIGSKYRKAVYRQYTSESFTIPLTHDPAMGILGPVIRAEAGDAIRIVFWNRASLPTSLHPHGSNLTTESPRFGQSVPPNDTFIYRWRTDQVSFENTSSSVVWTYRSFVDTEQDINAGLIGPIVIYSPGSLYRPTPGSTVDRPRGIDREVFTIMMTTDENQSRWFPASLAAAGIQQSSETLGQDPFFYESNRMYHINGFIYNNNPDLRLVYNSSVRWYVIAFGLSADDVHTAHWHGMSLLWHGHRADVIDLEPVSFEVVDLVPDNEGQWLFHCHVAAHFDAGMTAFYEVEKPVITGEEWGK